MGQKRMMRVIDPFFWKKNNGTLLFWENFFKGHCYQWKYRGATTEKKSYTLEKTFFFTEICFPWNNLVRLVSFSNGCTHE